jgi:hypothetical protein
VPGSRTPAGEADAPAGTYRQELVRCGKARCTRCADGPAHGPYWYLYYRRGGRLISKYIGRELPPDPRRPAAAVPGTASRQQEVG